MDISLQKIREAIIHSRTEAQIAGVEPEYVDAVASVIAALDLIGVRNATPHSEGSLVPITELPETFGEWASKYRITTHYDRFLAVMVYLYDRGQTSVNTSDVHAMYDKARWKRPANAADVFAKGADRALFTEAEGQGDGEQDLRQWRITRTGYTNFESLRME